MSRGRPKAKGRRSGRTLGAWTRYLRGEGVAPGAVTAQVDAAAELLAGTSEAMPDVTGEVAEALTAALGADEKIDLLVRCTAEGGRDLAKAARRALHAQRRRGAEVPRVSTRSAKDPTASDANDLHADARAHATAPFGDGNQILLFRFRAAADRVLYAAMANTTDELGLRELQLYRGGAKVYRTMVNESGGQVVGAAIPFGLALHRVQRAAATCGQIGRLVPGEMGTLRTLLGHDWPVSDSHPADNLTPSEVPADEALFALWDLPELRTWLPGAETLRVITESMDQVMSSSLVVPDQQRRAQLSELLDEAIASELHGTLRDRWAERLSDAAWVMHENQRPREASQVLAVRQQLQQTEAPTEIHFFRQLLGRLLLERLPPDLVTDLVPGVVRDSLPGEADEDGRDNPGEILWTPGSSTEPGKGGGGGLIIPGR